MDMVEWANELANEGTFDDLILYMSNFPQLDALEIAREIGRREAREEWAMQNVTNRPSAPVIRLVPKT